jgi:hypothetical protein
MAGREESYAKRRNFVCKVSSIKSVEGGRQASPHPPGAQPLEILAKTFSSRRELEIGAAHDIFSGARPPGLFF